MSPVDANYAFRTLTEPHTNEGKMNDTPKNMLETAMGLIPVTGPEILLFQDTKPSEQHLVVIPKDMTLIDRTKEQEALDTRLQPWRRKGTAQLQDIVSFITWANRNKGQTSIIFADVISAQPTLTCIADYLGAGAPVIDPIERDNKASYCQHRAIYAFPLSDEWKIWNAISDKPLSKAELGEFIEANAQDLLDPTPALLSPNGTPKEEWELRMLDVARQLQGRFGQYTTLMQLARAFTINETSNISTTLNRDTGESSIQFVNEHRQPDGQPINIPNLFMIAIPVFENGVGYRLPVRFRYRKSGQDIRFVLSLHNPDVCFRDAMEGAIAVAGAETGLPVLRGLPEV